MYNLRKKAGQQQTSLSVSHSGFDVTSYLSSYRIDVVNCTLEPCSLVNTISLYFRQGILSQEQDENKTLITRFDPFKHEMVTCPSAEQDRKQTDTQDTHQKKRESFWVFPSRK